MRILILGAIAFTLWCTMPVGARAVTHGTDPAGDEAVVGLGSRLPMCSGTLIALRVVLTAAHCIVEVELATAFFGPEPATAIRVAVAGVRLHPGFVRWTLENDVALVFLATDAPAKPVSIAPPAGHLRPGTSIRIVGYGSFTPSELATKRRKRTGTMTVREVLASTFRADPDPSCACAHDSGGAAFLGDALIGIVSGGDFLCEQFTVFSLVEAYFDFAAGARPPSASWRGPDVERRLLGMDLVPSGYSLAP